MVGLLQSDWVINIPVLMWQKKKTEKVSLPTDPCYLLFEQPNQKTV
jgi:hypothetical protein